MSQRRRLILGGSAVIILGILQLFWADGPAVAVCELLLGVYVVHAGARTRIVVSPDGIAYENWFLFYRIGTPWQNLASIGTLPMKMQGNVKVLCLCEPAAQGLAWLDWTVAPEWRGRCIPLPTVGGWANMGRLEAQLRRYASPLFATEETGQRGPLCSGGECP